MRETIAYHAPCQQQGHWIGKPALELFELIPGLEVREMNARCCGIAGTYGLKKEKYDIAMAVGHDLFEPDRPTRARSTVACDSETCRWQIAHATARPAMHPVDYLYRAYGLDWVGRDVSDAGSGSGSGSRRFGGRGGHGRAGNRPRTARRSPRAS